jgi:membrane associated rhomboid family serine protease
MIPLKDHNPSGTTPWLTYLIVGLNILVFLYMYSLGQNGVDTFIENFAMEPAEIVNRIDLHSLFTSIFLHGGIAHLVGNMMFLNIFGDNLEDRFGKILYLLFYFICGVLASLLQIIIYPFSSIPNLGASGAISGLLGGYLLLFPKHKIDVLLPFGGFLRTATLPAYTMLIYWIAFQLIFGIGSISATEQGGVAYFAHIGGFIAGILITTLIKPFMKKQMHDGS